jgi:hypothetical protein
MGLTGGLGCYIKLIVANLGGDREGIEFLYVRVGSCIVD